MPIVREKQANLAKASEMICQVAQKIESRPLLVCLPEFFNTLYVTEYFRMNAETIPNGETSICLSNLSKELKIFICGGSIPELDPDDQTILYNTCTFWSPEGNLLGTYRKLHMGDGDSRDCSSVKESGIFTGGSNLTTVAIGRAKVGIGICYDVHFEEMWRIYRNLGCNLLLIPAAWPISTGSLFAEVCQRARAVDTQSFVAMISPARDVKSEYVTWGHSAVVDPNGIVISCARAGEEAIVVPIDLTVCDNSRTKRRTFEERRTDIYETILKKKQ
ncbi:omega-amidase NIT2-like [Phlebotomus papatasi]|uniref:omega-amidase NIT2-like n=1 Tax=Phlebotomus papatasi TaxID=29031 RepID=UPI00248453BB|nr:omega-amidase NIT2-like [Phlebotomus papatasi]